MVKTKLKIILIFLFIFILFSCKKTPSTHIINFAFYETSEGEMILDKLIDNFENINPNIHINKIKIKKTDITNASFLQKNKIDIIRMDSEYLCKLKETVTILTLNDLIKQSIIDKFNNEAIASVTIDNKILGIPDNFGKHLLVYYHTNLIKRQPSSLSSLIKQNKKGIIPIFFDIQEPYYYTPLFLAFSKNMFTGNSQISFNNILKIFELSNKIKKSYDSKNKFYYSQEKDLFVKGKITAFIDGEWMLDKYKDMIADIGIVSSLTVNGKKLSSFASTKSYSVISHSKTSKNQDIKTELYKNFILFMSSMSSQVMWLKIKRLPSIKFDKDLSLIKKDPLLYASYQSLLNDRGKPCNKQLYDFYSFMEPRIDKYINGKISLYSLAYMTNRYLNK